MLNIRDEFEKWLTALGHKKYAPASVLACLEKASEYMVSRNIVIGGVWTIVEARKFNDVRNRMMRDKIYKLSDKRNFKLFEKIAALYYNFLNANELKLKPLVAAQTPASGSENPQAVESEPHVQDIKNEMTIAEAIIEVLKSKSPLSSIEVYKEIVARRLYTFGAAAPASVVLNTLMNHSENNTSYDRTSKRKYFKIIYLVNGSKAFALNKSEEQAVVQESDEMLTAEIPVSTVSQFDWFDAIVQAFGGWILTQGKSTATSKQYTSNIKVLVSRYQDEFESAIQEVDVKNKIMRFIELLIINPQFAEIEAAPAQHNRFTAALQALSEFFGSPIKIRIKSKPDILTASKTKTRVFDTPEAVIYDWENNEELYGSKPFSVQFFNTDKRVEVKNWTQLFITICEYIVERQPSIDFLLCNDSYSGTRMLCATDETELAAPKKLTNGQFVETNHSSNRLMKIAKLFLEYAGEDLSKVVIIYYPVSESTESTSDRQVIGNIDDLEKKVVEFVKTYRFKGASLDEVVEGLKDKRARVQRAIRAAHNIIEFGLDRYVYDDEFVDLDEAREAMKSILQRYFARFDGVATSKILYDAVKIKLEVFLNDNDLDDEQKIYWLAWHFFSKTGEENYQFYANCFIWEIEPNYTKSIGGLLVNLANNNGGFLKKAEAIDYLNQLKLSTQIQQAMGFSGSKRDFLLYNEDEYLYFPSTEISAEGLGKIQQALTRYFDDNPDETFIVIRDIDDSWLALLPPLPLGKPWTLLLLQDVICQNDLGFETIKCLKGQDADTLQAAIVRKKDRMSFADVVWDFLNKKYNLPREFSADELRFLIRDAGMIAGNELIYAMHKALDERRFVWQNNDTQVKVLALAR